MFISMSIEIDMLFLCPQEKDHKGRGRLPENLNKTHKGGQSGRGSSFRLLGETNRQRRESVKTSMIHLSRFRGVRWVRPHPPADC